MSRPASVEAVSIVACDGAVFSPVSVMTGAVVSMLLKVMLFVPTLPNASVALKYHVQLVVISISPSYFAQNLPSGE